MNLFHKTYISRISIITLLCSIILFSSSSQAQTIDESLNLIEKYYFKNIQSAEAEIQKIEPEFNNISNKNKLRLIVIKLSIAANQQNHFQLLQIKNRLPALLQSFGNNKEIWLSLLSLKVDLSLGNSPKFLEQLQALEAEIESHNNAYLSAVFNRALYYEFIRNNIIDVALDIAIKNKKQWLKQEQYYPALEMQYNITNLRVTMMMDASSEALINKLETEVLKLEADLYYPLITELKAIWYTRNGNAQKAYEIVEQALKDQNLKLSDNGRINLTSSLASISYQLKNYAQTISLLKELLEHPNLKNIQKIKQIKLTLAKALIESGQHEKAQNIILEIEKNIKDISTYAQFEIDNMKIDILYKSKNIDELYHTTKNMIKNITAPESQSHMERRVARAENAAHVEEQTKVVYALEKNNQSQQKELNLTKQLIDAKDKYLLILSSFCIVLIALFIWLIYLLKKVKKLANTDGLTQISNRRFGIQQAQKIHNKFFKSSANNTMAIAMMDLDHFKSINDAYGHDIGDEVIKASVNIALSQLSKNDVFCRMGGEEFLFAIKGASKTEIINKLDLIREKLYQFDTLPLGMSKPISASFGISIISKNDNLKISDHITQSDTALYDAKNSGRNKVSLFSIDEPTHNK
ncbi:MULTISPECIES: GGDEF domain-containing protein [unclassified Pseudoalteromonas]|uniref:GGDEF domain-containing protein n=1 Tax=unclassified Pseudoalteromonas TaxID=194690 RepID=UPI0005A95DAE|nr:MULTISPECIES: GGDEF domain-containing protein [unclassified Pseudoalteromonas]